jgi:hypothetical protein
MTKEDVQLSAGREEEDQNTNDCKKEIHVIK